MIILVCGLPGSGKSYFAERLSDVIGAFYISSDRVRKSLTKKPAYSEEAKSSVYKEMLHIAQEYASQNKNVLVDATFHKADRRLPFLSIFGQPSKPVIIEVRADETLIRERVKAKRAYSDADFEIYTKIRDEWEPITQEHLILNSTNNNIQEMLDTAITYIGTHDR